MKRMIAISVFALAIAGCNGSKNQTNIELNQNMMDQPNIKSQGWDHKNPELGQMRVPPEHTVARGHTPYKFATDPAGAEKDVNPLAGNMSPEILTIGREKFDIYCALCHGLTGHNDGTVTPKLPVKPRQLLSAEAMAYPDGRIFYAITMGRGVMGSYAGQIPHVRDRWAVVNYVRSLQKQAKQ